MSYDPNQQNQQWQQSPDPNQQQIQPVNQQGVSNQSNPGGGNYQQNQQSYTWTDGNTQGQHHHSSSSWSWQGTTSSPMPQTPSMFQPPQLPAISPMQNSHQQIHQQMLQNAQTHAQQAFAHHQQVMGMQQNMFNSMSNLTPMLQQSPSQPQITYQTTPAQPQISFQQNVLRQPQQQAQIEYQQNSQQQSQSFLPSPSPIPQQQQQQPQLQYQQNTYQQASSQQSTPVQPPHVHLPLPPVSQPQSVVQPQLQLLSNEYTSQHDPQPGSKPDFSHNEQRFQQVEKDRAKDLERINRAGADVRNRLRELEQSKAQAQQDNGEKDREISRLQEQLASVDRQRLQDAQRKSQQYAELARSQAQVSAAATPAFDISALQKVIRETQTQQLSAQDIERVIEEQVTRRLAGMATKADIQSAGAQMQNALTQVPAGLSQEQVQHAVNRELNNVMQEVANLVNQQRRTAAQGQAGPQLRSGPRSQVQTDFVIEELPDDAVATSSQRQPHRPRHGQKSQGALPPAASQGSGLPVASSTANRGPLPAASVSGGNMPVRPSGQVAPPSSSRRPQNALLEAPAPPSSGVSSGHQNPTAAAPNRPRHAAIEAAPMSFMGSPSSSQQAAPIRAPYAALEAPPSRTSENVNRRSQIPNEAMKAPPMRQLAALEASPVTQTAPPVPAHGQQNMQSVRPLRQIQGTPSQRQLDAPPVSAPTNMARGQPPAPRYSQIEAASSQRQLEAPPAIPEPNPGNGQELVRQGRSVAKRAPGKT